MRKLIVILGLCLIGLPREGHVSVQYESVSFERALFSSAAVVVAKYQGKDQYQILEVVCPTRKPLNVGDVILVDLCGSEIIRNAPEGESPLFPAYGELRLDERKKGDKTLLLLSARDKGWEFAVHPGILPLSEKAAIQKYHAACEDRPKQ